MARSVEEVREEVRLEALAREERARERAGDTEISVERIRAEIKNIAHADVAWQGFLKVRPRLDEPPLLFPCSETSGQKGEEFASAHLVWWFALTTCVHCLSDNQDTAPICQTRAKGPRYTARGNSGTSKHGSGRRSRPCTAAPLTPITPVTGWESTKLSTAPLLVPEMAGMAFERKGRVTKGISTHHFRRRERQEHGNSDPAMPSGIKPSSPPAGGGGKSQGLAGSSAGANKIGFRGSTRIRVGNVNTLASLEHTQLRGFLSDRKLDLRQKVAGDTGGLKAEVRPIEGREPPPPPKTFFVPTALRSHTQGGKSNSCMSVCHYECSYEQSHSRVPPTPLHLLVAASSRNGLSTWYSAIRRVRAHQQRPYFERQTQRLCSDTSSSTFHRSAAITAFVLCPLSTCFHTFPSTDAGRIWDLVTCSID